MASKGQRSSHTQAGKGCVFPWTQFLCGSIRKMQFHKFLIAGRYRGVHCSRWVSSGLKFSIIKGLKEKVKEKERRMGMNLPKIGKGDI